ncbi:hypothetical protein K435DRAFT_853046 [Dendrothele bispora CBS 962.96]|uniref:CCHC-type domain-containing protein n=1 Tax=Dendrothele bispora (strain CBS 962.96) TaxID=1314807 RepID=A0A4S8MJ76_DENBC|nr:hypothetical protein K435DRAFT_853046 [Dendrothele bispora CBS 962.96]
MSDLTKFNYDRLDNGGITKYLSWATYVEADLIARDLWSMVEITTPTTDSNGDPIPEDQVNDTLDKQTAARDASTMARARAALILRVMPSQLPHFQDQEDPMIRCYFCDELGHTKANCLERKAWLEGKEKKIGQANAAIDMDNSDDSDFAY